MDFAFEGASGESASEAFNDLECGVCSNVFNDDHCPRILPCSHTFCINCIDGIIKTQRKSCPLCREEFTAISARDLTVNRTVLNIAKQLSSMHIDSRMRSREPKPSTQERMKNIRKKIAKIAIPNCQDLEFQIVSVLGILNDMKDGVLKTDNEIEEVINSLQEVKLVMTKHLTQINRDTKLWNSNLMAMKQKREKLNGFDAKFKTSVESSSAAVIILQAEGVLMETEEKSEAFKKLLQKKERETLNSKMEILNADIKLKSIFEDAAKRFDAPSKDLSMDNDLQSLSDVLEGNIQNEIFVVKMLEAKMRVAPVKKGPANQLYVAHLAEGNAPPNCTVIKMESLMEKSTQKAFLDLGVGKTYLGRIIIKVIHEGNKGLNFLHMCAGDLGPSYANSRVSSVGDRGRDGEYMWVGEYEVEGGTSWKAVLSEVDWEKEKERDIFKETSWKAGQVFGSFLYGSASSFSIVTRDDPSMRDRRCFGMVEEGLDVVRDAILHYPDIAEITIVNCGLVFSH